MQAKEDCQKQRIQNLNHLKMEEEPPDNSTRNTLLQKVTYYGNAHQHHSLKAVYENYKKSTSVPHCKSRYQPT